MLNNTINYFRLASSRNVGLLFAVGSLLLGIWVAAIPQIKTRLGLSDASLGLSLLLAPVGALTGVIAAGYVFKKIPVGKWLLLGHMAYCLVFIAQVNAVNPLMLWISLFFSGFLGFLNGVSANATIDLLEKKENRKLMSTSHGMYSLGGFLSAALAAIFYTLHWSPLWQILIVAGLLLLMLFALRNQFLGFTNYIESDSSFRLPSGPVVGLAFICFVTFMGEGCVADWSALYLKESLGSNKAWAGIGFAGFSIAMALGRFNGDTLIPVAGSKRMTIAGSLLAAAGFILAISTKSIPLAILGFTLIGGGFSCIVPILMSAATRVPGISPIAGISAVASGGLLGFLAGPSLIGLVAEEYSIAKGLSILFFLTLVAAWVAWKNEFLINRHSKPPAVNYQDQHY